MIQQTYVNPGIVSQEALVEGAVQGLLHLTGVPPGPTDVLLRQVKEPVPPGVPQGLENIWRAWRLLQEVYSPGVDPEVLVASAIQGMLQATGDPAALYMTREQYQRAQGIVTGEYEGIGAVVVQQQDLPIIVSVVAGGPSDRAGLGPGDRIVAVNGEPIDGLTLEEQVALVKGRQGTQVRLLVLKPNGGLREMRLTRSTVPVASLGAQVLPQEIGYLVISYFTDKTGEQFTLALQDLLKEGIEALILDLRGNRGGAIKAAATVASQFVERGPLFYEIDSGGQRKDWSATPGGLAVHLPLAVVVDEETMSIAEAVAHALQDTGRGQVFGTQNLGTGTLQSFKELTDESALYVSTSRWYTPQGEAMKGKGVEPDVVVELTPRGTDLEGDSQVEEAYLYLQALIQG